MIDALTGLGVIALFLLAAFVILVIIREIVRK